MRGFNVDERDSTWERDDARYRIYVFKGADNATTTFDLLEATIEQALESALALSNGDEHLWSLALVENDSRGLRGLIWLSGMDYNDPPSSAREWQRRRQMQDRYLLDKDRRGMPPVLPNGLRVIRLFPEWVSGWPLWESFTDAYRLTGDDLALTPELSQALYDWNERWLTRHTDDPFLEAGESRASTSSFSCKPSSTGSPRCGPNSCSDVTRPLRDGSRRWVGIRGRFGASSRIHPSNTSALANAASSGSSSTSADGQSSKMTRSTEGRDMG